MNDYGGKKKSGRKYKLRRFYPIGGGLACLLCRITFSLAKYAPDANEHSILF